MSYCVDLLDTEFAAYFGCQPSDMRRVGTTITASGRWPLAVVVTTSGQIVSTDLIEREVLGEALETCPRQELLCRDTVQRLTGLLPARDAVWRIGEASVLLYCTTATFTPCDASAAASIPREDAFWRDAANGRQKTDRRHFEAAFAVFAGDTRVSTATVVDQGRASFRAIGANTKPNYRGRGYAKACVSAATRYALEHGTFPLYNTEANNAASLAVARAVGYREYIRFLVVT